MEKYDALLLKEDSLQGNLEYDSLKRNYDALEKKYHAIQTIAKVEAKVELTEIVLRIQERLIVHREIDEKMLANNIEARNFFSDIVMEYTTALKGYDKVLADRIDRKLTEGWRKNLTQFAEIGDEYVRDADEFWRYLDSISN